MSRFTVSQYLLISASVILGIAPFAGADTSDFGGYRERFKGGGDKVPPLCQIDVPVAASEPFFVKWNCSDNFAKAEDIRSELWIYRSGAPTGQLFGNFLGFPASVFIDAGALNATEFKQGLPVSFRLLARDKTGNVAASPSVTVRGQDNSLTGCTLQIVTDATESSGSTTGVPSSVVRASNIGVTVDQPSDTALNISATSAYAETCEIATICSNDRLLSFSSALTLSGESDAQGTLNVSPGGLSTEVSGSAAVSGVTLQSLSVDGETTIDGANAKVTLSCQK